MGFHSPFCGSRTPGNPQNPAPAYAGAAYLSRMYTVPMFASILILWPDLTLAVPSKTFMTTGIPYSRPTIAACDRLAPRSTTTPLIIEKTGVQLGDVVAA